MIIQNVDTTSRYQAAYDIAFAMVLTGVMDDNMVNYAPVLGVNSGNIRAEWYGFPDHNEMMSINALKLRRW